MSQPRTQLGTAGALGGEVMALGSHFGAKPCLLASKREATTILNCVGSHRELAEQLHRWHLQMYDEYLAMQKREPAQSANPNPFKRGAIAAAMRALIYFGEQVSTATASALKRLRILAAVGS